MSEMKTTIIECIKEIQKMHAHFQSTSRYYDMDTNPITFEEWLAYMLDKSRDFSIIEHTLIGDYLVSTVYLGLNHSYCHNLPPLIFETMIFNNGDNKENDPIDMYQKRYTFKYQAIEGHARAVKIAKREIMIEDEDEDED